MLAISLYSPTYCSFCGSIVNIGPIVIGEGAKIIAEIANTTTLTEQAIKLAKQLGYSITVQQPGGEMQGPVRIDRYSVDVSMLEVGTAFTLERRALSAMAGLRLTRVKSTSGPGS